MSAIFNDITQEMYEMEDENTALHHKIGMWHARFDISSASAQFTEEAIGKWLMSSQRLLYQLDPAYSREMNDVTVRQELSGSMGSHDKLFAAHQENK